ncbi:27_t:CDS:2 [Ambispora gerdemannii]|uniref:27_t:CDS:1 n=1 Tax=Ambispora gerdemannii TaxID=144530 RepID=A0A9N8VWB7_9GLOM|nr:27_t:CDS:2 [Ambispora gerdemannii]
MKGKPTNPKKSHDPLRKPKNAKKIAHQKRSAATSEYQSYIEKFRADLNLFPVPFSIDEIYGVNEKMFLTKENKVKRPPNSFILFRLVVKKLINIEKQKQKGDSFFATLEQPLISKIVGALWNNTTDDEKESYETLAEELKDLHKKFHPDYKYQPKRDRAIWKVSPQMDTNPNFNLLLA